VSVLNKEIAFWLNFRPNWCSKENDF